MKPASGPIGTESPRPVKIGFPRRAGQGATASHGDLCFHDPSGSFEDDFLGSRDVNRAAPQREKSRETLKMSQPAQRQINLVVVDDDPSIVRIITQLIQNEKGDTVNLVSFDDPPTCHLAHDFARKSAVCNPVGSRLNHGNDSMKKRKRSCQSS